MEVLVHATALSAIPPPKSQSPPNLTSNNGGHSSLRRKRFLRENLISSSSSLIRSIVRSEKNQVSIGCVDRRFVDDGAAVEWGRDSGCVEVVGIGSRKDAVLDFCLESPFQSLSSCLRFWNILSKDSQKVQLQQRTLEKGFTFVSIERETTSGLSEMSAMPVGGYTGVKNLEVQSYLLTSPCALILVASAGYGSDHITAIELLKAVKSAHGLAVCIILKPFSFEGQRRKDEVNDLINKLQEEASFCIVVDTDALLKKEVVTLAEALKTANNAVLLAINSISLFMSEMQKKYLDHPNNRTKEIQFPEVVDILGNSEAAKVGFGAGKNMKTSIARAVYDCPFVDGGIKDFSGLLVCTLATACAVDRDDTNTFLHVFRQTTGWKQELLVAVVHEPNLEPDIFVTTVIFLGSKENVSQKSGFFSGFVSHFPFVFSLFKREHQESKHPLSAHSVGNQSSTEDMQSLASGDKKKWVSSNLNNGNVNICSEEQEMQKLLGTNHVEINGLRQDNDEDERTEVGILNSESKLVSGEYDQTSEGFTGEYGLERESLIFWNAGPASHTAQQWAKERAVIFDSAPLLESQYLCTLPVGVKPSGKSIRSRYSANTELPEPRTSDDRNGKSQGVPRLPSWDALTDSSFDAVTDRINNASTLLNGRRTNASRKQGLLSSRAASMLEAERESQKKWSPVVEMSYRGGIYKGRCQGGLPEGKGHLTLADGSIYDGMWRYGKRSGTGTLYYSNGDVFQGSWRDDLMHGKGWFYFHAGDRWFANFWKGKANGEGRFYSKDGEIFFGNFHDGWRHGHCLCIDTNGTRWAEIWNEGSLLSREQLDSDSGKVQR
ncbi:hypothetical protein Sjap_014648 [Stephania japonica]|uniref:Protein ACCUMULATION AND REPLICATION OF CHLOROPLASTS 3 n=1 Tax=Stephania japonica TaxID=461633 RepID=A0AAP0IHP2_9MAGN